MNIFPYKWKVREQRFRSWFKEPKQRQRGVSGRRRIRRKLRWTDFRFCRDNIVRNFIHWCQVQASLLFEDYWKRDFRWNSYGYLGSCSAARVTIFQRELFETRSLTKHVLQKVQYIAYVCYHNTWRSIWYLLEIDKNMLLDV